MPVPSQRGDYFCCFVKKYAKNPSNLKHRLPVAKKCCKTIQAGLTYLQMPLIRSNLELLFGANLVLRRSKTETER